MQLTSGARLGPYEITAPIGAGGMGQVYRATDTRLDRSVAIKILPSELASNPQFKLRFEREAKTVSQLNHPNICALYDVGHDGTVDYLVMEYLEGDSLADRLATGPLPLIDLLKHGVQIADALDKAHRQGIVHRDLKPGNVMLTKSGAKLLDFGLAKPSGTSQPVHGLTDLATEHKPLTEQGTILGTYQYMSPEQLSGDEADARSDIFALGTVLYEMATGQRAFTGKNKTSLVASIISGEPRPLSELQPLTPPALEHVIRKCLSKDPDDRWQSAHDIAEELSWISEVGSKAGVAMPLTLRRKGRERIAWSLVALLALTSAALTMAYVRRAPKQPAPVRFSIPPPPGTALMPYDDLGVALSPDGQRVAFGAIGKDGKKQIWIRALDSMSAQALPETNGAWYPFWSPDGRYIGFFADGKLKKIDVRGGAPVVICDAPSGRGGSWNRDNVILFAPNIVTAIHKVSANGGASSPATNYDEKTEETHRWPQFLPDGKHFFYMSRTRGTGKEPIGRLFVASLDAPEGKLVAEDASNGIFIESTGQLIFSRGSVLLAQPFDPERLETTGDPTPIVKERVSYHEPKNLAVFSASENGSLVYLPTSSWMRQMQWVDRSGRFVSNVGEPALTYDVRLSPDQTKVVYARGTDNFSTKSDLWIHDLEGQRAYRLTFQPMSLAFPRWSPASSRIVFMCQPSGTGNLCLKALDDGKPMEVILAGVSWKIPGSWTPDGNAIIYSHQDPVTNEDIWLLPLTGERKPELLFQTPFDESVVEVSPDGKWMAYVSSESGASEIHVRAMSGSARQWQISTDGGLQPRWRGDGKELYFTGSQGKVIVVPIALDPFRPGEPRPLFDLPDVADREVPIFEDVTRDGERFLLNVPVESRSRIGFNVILHWDALGTPD